jgi:hypothetical protein
MLHKAALGAFIPFIPVNGERELYSRLPRWPFQGAVHRPHHRSLERSERAASVRSRLG